MPRPSPIRDLVHPLFLGALGLLLLNDHVLKGSAAVPAWLSGKLSDFAGLFFFPVLLFALLDLATRGRVRARRSRSAYALAALTAVVFALFKVSPSANAWVNAHWGATALDATDLVALPSALASALFLGRRQQGRAPEPREMPWTSRALRFAALALAAFASLATSPPFRARNYPVWRFEMPGERRFGCAGVTAWVSKSGKQGLGVTMELTPHAQPCAVELRSARFVAGNETHDAAVLPPRMTLSGPILQYVPFEFDNEALWNRGVRTGRLELVLIADGIAEQHVAFALRHGWNGPHLHERRRPHSATTAEPRLVRPADPTPLPDPAPLPNPAPRFAEPP